MSIARFSFYIVKVSKIISLEIMKIIKWAIFFENVPSVVLGVVSPVIRYSPDKGSGAAAATGFI